MISSSCLLMKVFKWCVKENECVLNAHTMLRKSRSLRIRIACVLNLLLKSAMLLLVKYIERTWNIVMTSAENHEILEVGGTS